MQVVWAGLEGWCGENRDGLRKSFDSAHQYFMQHHWSSAGNASQCLASNRPTPQSTASSPVSPAGLRAPRRYSSAVARNEGSKQVGEVQHTMSAPAPIWAGMSMSDSVAERGHH
uniref:Uncharacterized protein n=1 Tax=Eutreptiella gymnastica TaxID=73025 RepID=A0A7S4FPH6_9EUGL|mmetsp:Transcript_68901/g.110333  ORF Transcript_68901/g.110333 Transcript_68901/m.110333 type:complete len:114 (+) Transcript_68901:36-377(+)